MKSPKIIALSVVLLGSLLLMGFSALNFSDSSPNVVFEENEVTSGCQTNCDSVPSGPISPAPIVNSQVPAPKAKATPFANAEMKAQLQRVADMYEYQSQFPSYSYPISASNLQQFIPNRHIPTSLPLGGLGLGDDLNLVLGLNKFQFFWGETIEVTATANLGEDTSLTHAQFQLVTADGEPVFTKGSAADQVTFSQNQASGSLILSEVNAPNEQDFYVVATVRAANHSDRFEIRTPLKISHKIGTVEDVANAYVEGSHLIIPVNVTLKDDGYYLLSANLYSDSNEPLMNLSAKGKFSAYDDTIELKAHYSALSAKHDEGPYQLGDFELKMLPAKPGAKSGYGEVPDKEYDVQGYPFKDYDQSPYVDLNIEAKVEFLRTLSTSQG
ncbi:hypothetical protein [Litoribrevibacter albus]|nr:hypothetical protein [Litoribrevibacter albus]